MLKKINSGRTRSFDFRCHFYSLHKKNLSYIQTFTRFVHLFIMFVLLPPEMHICTLKLSMLHRKCFCANEYKPRLQISLMLPTSRSRKLSAKLSSILYPVALTLEVYNGIENRKKIIFYLFPRHILSHVRDIGRRWDHKLRVFRDFERVTIVSFCNWKDARYRGAL